MQTGQIIQNIVVGGISFTATTTRSAPGQISQVVDIPAGIAGAISAAGVDGLATGHGLVQTDVIDVHWDDPSDGTHKCRRGLTIDTAAANAIEFDETPAGEGDALPAEDTAVVVSKQVPVETTFDGDALKMIACKCGQRVMADFREDAASQKAVKLVASEAWSWVSGQDIENPFAGNPVVSIKVSNGSLLAAIFQVGLLYQSV